MRLLLTVLARLSDGVIPFQLTSSSSPVTDADLICPNCLIPKLDPACLILDLNREAGPLLEGTGYPFYSQGTGANLVRELGISVLARNSVVHIDLIFGRGWNLR